MASVARWSWLALAGVLAACGGATVSGTGGAAGAGGGGGAGTGGGGTGGLAASGGAGGSIDAGGSSGSAGAAGCPSGFADCNADPADGCETNIAMDPDNCGSCGNVCSANSSATCSGGICQFMCCDQPGYADCDGTCTCVDLDTDPDNCGFCGNACSAPNSACKSGVCSVPDCPSGFADCNAQTSDGCETNLLTDPSNCGACGKQCPSTGGTPQCFNGSCFEMCCDQPGFADCDGNCATACQDLMNDLQNCGVCSKTCLAEPHSSSSCTNGVCQLQCDPGYADCDGQYSTGCETDLSSDANNCGSCGNQCPTTNGTPSCVNGSCGPCGCTAGYADCNGTCADGCETNVSSNVNNCGGCGIVCSANHATALCLAGACQPQCDPGWGDCDGNPTNGCETDLTSDANNCGGCGQACGSSGGCVGNCVSGVCGLCACTPPQADCDGDPSNGCETNVTSDANNCGTCGTVCASGQSCVSGSCQ